MSSILAQRNLTVDESGDKLLCAKVKLIEDPAFELDIQLETHLKHLIDIYSKILYMNKSQIPLVNYNLQDAYRIVDSLGGFLSTTKYYDKDVMYEAYQTIPLRDRLEQVHGLMNKYLVFLQYFSDVGV